MLISIVIPVFNAHSTLKACLESVLRQTFQDREVIVVDGGSTDGSVDIIRSFSPFLASWISEPDSGIYDAANKGMRLARGNWIYFLGADDLFFNDTALERMAPHLRSASASVRVLYGRVAMLDKGGEVLTLMGNPWHESRRRLLSYMCIPHQGTFHHRSLFQELGEFDPTYRAGGDYEFLLRELMNRDAVFTSEITVAACRTGGRSGQAAGYIKLLREWRRAQRHHGLVFPTMRWRVALWGAFFQRFLYFVLGQKAGARLFDFVRRIFGKSPYWSRIQ